MTTQAHAIEPREAPRPLASFGTSAPFQGTTTHRDDFRAHPLSKAEAAPAAAPRAYTAVPFSGVSTYTGDFQARLLSLQFPAPRRAFGVWVSPP